MPSFKQTDAYKGVKKKFQQQNGIIVKGMKIISMKLKMIEDLILGSGFQQRLKRNFL